MFLYVENSLLNRITTVAFSLFEGKKNDQMITNYFKKEKEIQIMFRSFTPIFLFTIFINFNTIKIIII